MSAVFMSRLGAGPAVDRARIARRWWTFALERFPPAQYLPLILVVALAHVAVFGAPLAILPFVAVGMGAFFFKLRLYDELKDYEDDKLHKPTRPLVRGLVTHREVAAGIVACFAIEAAAFGALGVTALVGVAVAGAYSLLMSREFFIGRWLRARLTTYAVTHTVVAGLLTLAVACAALQRMPWQLPPKAFALAAVSFCLFNVFEFARKTWATREEKPESPSYSRVHGRFGAVLLVVAMVIGATALLATLHLGLAPSIALYALAAVVTAAGAGYAVIDDTRFAAVYRGVAGVYLLGVYAVCAAACLV